MTAKKKPSPAPAPSQEPPKPIELSPVQQGALAMENNSFLMAQVEHLQGRVGALAAENAALRETVQALTPLET